ncbi:MAG: hypothetical protein ACI8RE_000930 [Ilumatobacter sp.]|jgi:hypothetical protein
MGVCKSRQDRAAGTPGGHQDWFHSVMEMVGLRFHQPVVRPKNRMVHSALSQVSRRMSATSTPRFLVSMMNSGRSEFVECCRHAEMLWAGFDAEFVVAASQVLE